ncbi:hypothetical protein BZJ19_16555 [Salinivibrio proteolyticus]|uniref:hypothetical protein n=1 Tax=Salinivibrio proteolyticus TaxID=334715 RepID=UPI000988FD79|nr:hypothetical protein [Salinivibrio proteolyticus]OOF21252.1 hypothetical protein BZJ19_16555 [Salinivibrio proteolyticus]
MNKPDFTFPIQTANQHKEKFSKEDPVNADLLAKRKALTKLCKKYNSLINYLTALAEDETASHGDRLKAVSKLLDLQDKLAKQLDAEEDKVRNVRAAEEAEKAAKKGSAEGVSGEQATSPEGIKFDFSAIRAAAKKEKEGGE